MKIRAIIIFFALLAFLTASIGGTLYYYSMKEDAVLKLHNDVDAQVAEIAYRINLYLSNNQKIADTLAGIKELQYALESKRPDKIQEANAVLDLYKKALSLDVCYLLDSAGQTIASSNRSTPESIVGKNYAFRPYFKDALQGNPSLYMALGVTSGKQGVYFSHPVYSMRQTAPSGVVVIKATTNTVENEIKGMYAGTIMLVDPRGVIFFSSRPDWLYHLLWKLPPAAVSEIEASQQFGKGPLAWTGMVQLDKNHAGDSAGKRYMIHSAPISNIPGWEVIYMHDLEMIPGQIPGMKFRNVSYIILIGCALIAFISAILYKNASNEIRKRRMIEEELQGSNHRMHAMITASPLPITIIDIEGKCLLWNPAAEQVFGWTAQEVLDKPLPMIPNDREEECRKFRKMNFEGTAFKSVESQRLRRDGVLIDIALSTAPLRNADGVITAAMGIYEDITERKKAEDEIRFLAAIIQNLPEAVCAIDLLGNVVAWNSRAESLLGYRADEIIGKPVTTVIPEEIAQQELDHCLNLLNTNGYFSGYESVRLTRDGKRIPVELTAVAIRDRAKIIKNYASIMTDLTDRKKAEEERLKGHMLESIGILAGGIAHDFNNLLNVIIGNIAVAKMSLQAGDKAYGRLDDAENVCGIAGELSKRLITFATGGDPLKRSMSLSALFTNTVNMMLKDSTINVEIDFPEDLYRVAVDEGQIKQVINNLVINAKEAMQGGGTLTIRGENLRITAKDNIPIREGDYLRISVQDTGAGIPAENLARIFDPYYSTKDTYSQRGLGLGLAVCYSIIKRHEGLITVESQPGQGTIFKIYLLAVKNGQS